MISPHVSSVSISPYIKDIHQTIIKDCKYFRVVHQFNQHEDFSAWLLARFFKKLKRVKTLKILKLEAESSTQIQLKPQVIHSVLKFNSLKIRECCVSGLPHEVLIHLKKIPLKKVNRLYIKDQANMKNLKTLKALKDLFIHIQSKEKKTLWLSQTLFHLSNLENLCLLTFPSSLSEILAALNEFSLRYKRAVKFQITTSGLQNYNNEISHLSYITLEKITKLSLYNIRNAYLLDYLFSGMTCQIPNLKNLKLGFIVANTELTSYLKYLKDIPFLEKLSLYFTECWAIEFVKGIFANIKLPASLLNLKINMPLALEQLITKGFINIKEKQGKDTFNIFEEEITFISFFESLKAAKNLKKIELGFQMLESFESHYTNFFVSIMNRLLNLSSFSLQIADCVFSSFREYIPKPFDLSLLLESCSKLESLEHLQIIVPNLSFENAKIYTSMNKLQSFNIGVSEANEENRIKFQNISKLLTDWIGSLLLFSPRLNSLILDFNEEITERDINDRFSLIQGFKELESFCSKYIVRECSSNVTRNIGKVLQSLKRLNTVVIKFEESDKNVLDMMVYLKYHKSLKEVLISFDNNNWIGDGCLINTLEFNTENGSNNI